MYDFTNVDPVKCCTWLVLPTVYDESLSYGEQLNKFCKALNELIENNNNIPDYVSEMIQNYITSGAIDEVVRNILASYILNVKYPPKGISPAVGDGSADDTEAIQGCIDYAFNQGGGCVYLPYGKYLSRSLTLRSGVSLVGFDRYSTKVVQRGGDTKPLLSGGNVQNVQIANLTLDGNNEVQTDDLDVVNVLGKDVLLTNLVIKSGYQCLVYNGLGGDLQVNNVVFGGAVKKVAVINGKDSAQFESVKFNELGKIQGECVLEVGASDGVYRFSSKAVAPICIISNGSRNSFECDVINSTDNYVDNGSMNNFNILGVEVKEQLAKGKSSSVGGSVTESVSGSKTETVGDGKVENITGSKTETITENKTENITGNREIDIDGTDSIHIDGVSTLNIGGDRTEVYASSVNKRTVGTNTEIFEDTSTSSYNKKRIINCNDISINPTNPIQITNGFNNSTIYNTLVILDKDGNERKIMIENNNTNFAFKNIAYTSDIDLLNTLLENSDSVVMLGGTYTIDKTLIIPNGKSLYGNGANLSVNNELDYAINVGDTFGEASGNTGTSTTLSGITLQCHYKSSGILIKVSSSNVTNIKITGAKTTGIDIYNNELVGSSPIPSDSTLSNIQIYWENSVHTFTPYGIRVYGTDNDLKNIRTLSTIVGVYQAPGAVSLFCSQCHLLGADGFNDIWKDTVGYYLEAGYVTLTDCYSDKFRIGIKITGTSTRIVTNAFRYLCDKSNSGTEPRYVITYVNPGEFSFNNTSVLSDPIPYLHKEQAGIYYGSLDTIHFDHYNTGIEPINFNLTDDSYFCTVAGKNSYNIHSNKSHSLVAVLSAYTEGTPCEIRINNESFFIADFVIQCNPTKIITNGYCSPTSEKVNITIYQDNTNSLYVFVDRTITSDTKFNVSVTGSSPILIARESDNIELPSLTLLNTINYNA